MKKVSQCRKNIISLTTVEERIKKRRQMLLFQCPLHWSDHHKNYVSPTADAGVIHVGNNDKTKFLGCDTINIVYMVKGKSVSLSPYIVINCFLYELKIVYILILSYLITKIISAHLLLLNLEKVKPNLSFTSKNWRNLNCTKRCFGMVCNIGL